MCEKAEKVGSTLDPDVAPRNLYSATLMHGSPHTFIHYALAISLANVKFSPRGDARPRGRRRRRSPHQAAPPGPALLLALVLHCQAR